MTINDETRSEVTTQVLVDTRGIKILQPEISCAVDGSEVRFIISDEAKVGHQFHFGLFANQSAYSSDVNLFPFDRRACVLLESPINNCYRDLDELVRRFPVIFTHQRQLLDRGDPFAPLMFGTNWISVRNRSDADDLFDAPPRKDKLVSFIGSLAHSDDGAYRHRRKVAEYCLQRGDIDCFGKGIREVPGKREAIGPYRFSIAMENARSDHYFSEKLVDCVLLQTVPIYYGCPGIVELLDSRGMLTFETIDELHAILDRLSPKLYDEMRTFVQHNAQTLISRGWYSHQSLFQHISVALSSTESLNHRSPPLCTTRESGWLGTFWKRLKRETRHAQPSSR